MRKKKKTGLPQVRECIIFSPRLMFLTIILTNLIWLLAVKKKKKKKKRALSINVVNVSCVWLPVSIGLSELWGLLIYVCIHSCHRLVTMLKQN